MKLKNVVLAVLAGSAAIAAPAFADNGWHRGWHRAPARVVVRPAPVVASPYSYSYYYGPAPVYYTPAPVYYRPVPVAPVMAAPGISIRFHLPL
jgi:hypothetical protein